MTWATVTAFGKKVSTHYYPLGTTSLCLMGSLVSDDNTNDCKNNCNKNNCDKNNCNKNNCNKNNCNKNNCNKNNCNKNNCNKNNDSVDSIPRNVYMAANYKISLYKYCKHCRKLLKSKKIHSKISQQERATKLYREESHLKYRKSLDDMMYCWLEFESRSRSVKLDELDELLSEEYPGISHGAILVFLLATKKITISQDCIIAPAYMEDMHVKPHYR